MVWKLLALTLATHFAVFVLRDYMRGKNRWLRLGKLTVAVVLVALMLIGVQDLRGKDWSGKVVRRWEAVTKVIGSARDWLGRRL